MLNQYEQDGEFYKIIVPQLAWQSRAVRELVIAAVNMDQKWLNIMQKAPSGSTKQTFTHYCRALQDIREGNTSKLETLVASLVAWTVESMPYNYGNGLLRLSGARKLIGELEHEASESGNHSTYELVHGTMRAFLATSEGHQAFTMDPQPDAKSNPWLAQDNFETYRARRGQISGFLGQYHQIKPTKAELHDFLSCWENAIRTYRNDGQGPMILKEALHLLFLIALTLAPKDEIGSTKYSHYTNIMTHILTRVAIALRMRRHLDTKDCEILEETIQLIVMRLFDFFPDEQEWWAHKNLIEKIAQESHAVFERTKVLQTLSIKPKELLAPVTVDLPEFRHIAFGS